MSVYRLQVIDTRTGEVAIGWQPGDRVETEIRQELVTRLKGKGVGIFRSEAKVLAALEEAFRELLYDLKRRV